MQRQSLRTPVAQPMAEVSSVPGPMPDLAFLIVEIRAFSKWWMMRPEPTVAHVHGLRVSGHLRSLARPRVKSIGLHTNQTRYLKRFPPAYDCLN